MVEEDSLVDVHAANFKEEYRKLRFKIEKRDKDITNFILQIR
jgi:hypothetical protein